MSARETGTLGKTMAILDMVAQSPAPLRFSDIMALTGEPRGSLHRRLCHMLSEGLLETGGDGRYRLGLRLLSLASFSWSNSDIRLIARPHLEALHEKVQETVHFGLLTGVQIIYLDKVEAMQSVRMHSRVGALSPVYCTGIGKAALARLGEGDMRQLLGAISFKQYTRATVSNGDELHETISTARQEGFAYDFEEHEAGINCIAAGIAFEKKVGGVSIAAPAYRADRDRLDTWKSCLADAASRIEIDLSARLGPAGLTI